jgi:hypothetical protein
MTISAIAAITHLGYALPNPPPKADSMWISTDSVTGDPTKNTIDGSKIGLNGYFSVYVWMNVTTHTSAVDGFDDSGANSWSFFLVYDTSLLKNISCTYTGVGKSLWSKALPTTPLTPSWGLITYGKPQVVNDSWGYLIFGEALNTAAELANMGSLGNVTFQVINATVTLTSDLRLDQTKPFETTVVDYGGMVFNPIPLQMGLATYSIPEFPLTTLLVALFAVTSIIVLIVKRIPRPKTNNRHGSTL